MKKMSDKMMKKMMKGEDDVYKKMMGELDGKRGVSVMADDKKGLEKGLDKAKDLIGDEKEGAEHDEKEMDEELEDLSREELIEKIMMLKKKK